MTPGDVAWLLALGLMAGWVGGLIGVGGSIVMIPGLSLWFGGGALHLHQAAAMLVNFFVVAPAVLQHRRAGAIAPRVVRWTIPGAVAGAL
ncbi:MAG: sulfite exporter TauE/SafE family protein, partial [Phycisphaerae bacterium]|nr:sulfite exporter TauE/SafE family protein [Phycisphaerae bacterium]